MITKGMTPDEVVKTLQKIDDYVLGRRNGLSIKNNKKLKSRFVQNNAIMSCSSYVVPDIYDTVVVYAVKQNQVIKGKEYASMDLIYYLKTQYDTYILPCIDFARNRVVRYVEFTCHSIDRMKMRLGKDFDTFFREDYIKKNNSLFHLVKYDYNGDDNEYVAHIGDAFVFLENEDSGKRHTVKTLLSIEELYCNQLRLKLDSKMIGEADVNDIVDFKSVVGESNFKALKKAGVLKGVA